MSGCSLSGLGFAVRGVYLSLKSMSAIDFERLCDLHTGSCGSTRACQGHAVNRVA